MTPHRTPCRLLSLPEAVLHEVLSWVSDPSSANALLSTCRTGQRLRRDPSAVALQLLRRRPLSPDWHDWEADVTIFSSACPGGSGAVVRQVLQLLHASPECGGPHPTPARLLPALLCASAACGDVTSMKLLLALPQPPDVDNSCGRPLRAALDGGPHPQSGPHLAAMRVLLDAGADPCLGGHTLMRAAAWGKSRPPHPDQLLALQLMLQRAPLARRQIALAAATEAAAAAVNTPALKWLLCQAENGKFNYAVSAQQAAGDGSPDVLQLLITHGALSAQVLNWCLGEAVVCGCAPLAAHRPRASDPPPGLLRSPAGAGAGAGAAGESPQGRARRLQTVSLLLRLGAVTTPAVHRVATQRRGGADLAALLEAADAVVG